MTYPLLVGTRRRAEDVEVARQLHRHHRAARGDVRQDDVDPGRARCRSGGTLLAERRAPATTRWSGSSSWRAGSPRAGTGRRARGAGEEHFTRVVRARRGARGRARASRCPTGDPGPPAGAPRRRGSASRRPRGAAADPAGRREGERRAGGRRSTSAARALAGALLQVGKRRFARLVTGSGARPLYFFGRPQGRRRKVPVTRP